VWDGVKPCTDGIHNGWIKCKNDWSLQFGGKTLEKIRESFYIPNDLTEKSTCYSCILKVYFNFHVPKTDNPRRRFDGGAKNKGKEEGVKGGIEAFAVC
nr:hypothetical protein [Tanacetum cinerariifolium]